MSALNENNRGLGISGARSLISDFLGKGRKKELAALHSEINALTTKIADKERLDKAKTDPVGLFLNIIRLQRSLYTKEVNDYLIARQQAIDIYMPRRLLITQLNFDVETDAFIMGQKQNRILRIKNKKFKIVNKTTGEKDDAKTDLLRRQWFKDFLYYYMESKFWGYSLVYFDQIDSVTGQIKNVSLVYRENVVPQNKLIVRTPYDTFGQYYDQPPLLNYTIGIGKPEDLGMYEQIALLWIFKKHSWKSWDQFEERFGIPIAIGKTASTDKKVQQAMADWLKDLTSAASAVFPTDSNIETLFPPSTDVFSLFNEKRKAVNEEIAILVNGQTLTSGTAKSGTRAQGNVHERTQLEIEKDDAEGGELLINEELLLRLSMLGYPFTNEDQFQWDDADELEPLDKVKVYTAIAQMGFQINKEDVEQTFGVVIDGIKAPALPPDGEPGEGEDDPKPGADDDPDNDGGNGGAAAPPKNNRPAKASHAAHAHGLEYRTATISRVAGGVYSVMKGSDKLIKQIWDRPGDKTFSPEIFQENTAKLVDGLMKGFKKVSADFDSPDHVMRANLQANLWRFGSDKTVAEVYELNKLIKDPELDNYTKFREKAMDLMGTYNERYLQVEYDLAIGVSETQREWQDFLETKEDIPYWKFVTSGGGTVCEICGGMDGMTFSKDDDDAQDFIPPIHFGCECDMDESTEPGATGVSSVDDVRALDPELMDKYKDAGFLTNRNDSMEVFNAAQSYLNDLPDADKYNLNDLDYKDFGLNPLKDRDDENRNALHTPSEKWISDHKDENGRIPLSIYDGSPAWLDVDVATAIAHHNELLPSLSSILAKPKEVWFTEGKNSAHALSFIAKIKGQWAMAQITFNKKQPMKVVTLKTGVTNNMRKGLQVYFN